MELLLVLFGIFSVIYVNDITYSQSQVVPCTPTGLCFPNCSNVPIVSDACMIMNPAKLLQISFTTPTDTLKCGSQVSAEDVGDRPFVKFMEADKTKLYVIMLIDADSVDSNGKKLPKNFVRLQWMLAGIPGHILRQGTELRGQRNVTEYEGPKPEDGTGSHRYQIYLFQCPNVVDPMRVLDVIDGTRENFDVDTFCINGEYGCYVASFQFISEFGLTRTLQKPKNTGPVIDAVKNEDDYDTQNLGDNGGTTKEHSGSNQASSLQPALTKSTTIGYIGRLVLHFYILYTRELHYLYGLVILSIF